MSKRTFYLLLAGLIIGGGLAAYLHWMNPTPDKREDGSWLIPHNPFASGTLGDWQHVEITAEIPDGAVTFYGQWSIRKEEDQKLHRYFEAFQSDEPQCDGIFSRNVVPSFDEFLGVPSELISDLKFRRATRTVDGREFACTRATFMLHGNDGEWVAEELWFAKDVKGTGLVAWSMNINDEFKLTLNVKGFGGKDTVDWGQPYDRTRLSVSGTRAQELAARFRSVLAKKYFGQQRKARAPERTDDEVLVDLKDGTSLGDMQAFALRHHITLRLEAHDPSAIEAGLAIAHIAPEREADLIKELEADPLCESAEHNLLFTIPDEDTFDEGFAAPRDQIPEEDAGKPRDGFPNDSLFDKQWHMRMIHAPEAWKVSKGKGIIVGVIDTGVAYEKKKGMLIPDLEKTTFVEGYDFVNDDRIAADDHGHGSHCAGTIAQSTDNGRGCVGVAPEATIMPIKVLSASGSGSLGGVVAGIRYAADHGCKVLSLSLGGGGYAKAMANAVKYAHDKGCVVCCAAGNSGRGRVEYPAAYPGALAVSSVGPSGQKAFYSSYGKEVWVAGPGGDKSKSFEDGVLQNTIDPRAKKSFYGFWQGTSMATPHVSGVAALIMARGVTNPDKVMEILAATATKNGKTGQGHDEQLGYGIVDAEGAVKAASAPDRAALVAVAVLLILTFLVMRGRDELSTIMTGLAAYAGACGLGFAGLSALPEWGQGNPLFASAAIPFFLGLVSVKHRAARSLAVGLMLGSAAHLISMSWFRYTDVAFVPAFWHLDQLWLAANGVFLVVGTAMVIRLSRSKTLG
jgi:serine protease